MYTYMHMDSEGGTGMHTAETGRPVLRQILVRQHEDDQSHFECGQHALDVSDTLTYKESQKCTNAAEANNKRGFRHTAKDTG